jgi:hypothetical protein
LSGLPGTRTALRFVLVVAVLFGGAVAAASAGIEGISTVVPFVGAGPGTVRAGGAKSVLQQGGKAKPNPGVQQSIGPNGLPIPIGSQPPGGVLPSGAPLPPGTAPTQCGASFQATKGQTYMQALAYEESILGPLQAVRVFYPGAPAPWPGNAGNVNRTVVVSFKFKPTQVTSGAEDSLMQSWFANAPRDRDIYWVYYHEPEDDIDAGQFTAAQYRAAWTHLAALAKAADNPRLHATLVLMQWSVAAGSHRNWLNYYAGSDVIDVLGWDVYNLDFRSGTGDYDPGSKLLAPVIAASASVGKPWGIAELGGALLKSDPSGAQRAAWLNALLTITADNHALWTTYFDLDWENGAYDYRIRDSYTKTVWSNFCGGRL